MGKHSAHRNAVARQPRFLRTRLVLALGVLVAPAGVGTMAYWTDSATIKSGPIKSGSLDLTVGATVEDSGHLPGQGGTFEYSQLTIANMVPGESIARPFVVRNSGTVGFDYNATVRTADNGLTSGQDGLQMQVVEGGVPANSGTEAAGNRKGSCTGGTTVMSLGPVTTTPRAVHANKQTLAATSTKSYCAVIHLSSRAPNALQGKGTSLIIALDATQVGAS